MSKTQHNPHLRPFIYAVIAILTTIFLGNVKKVAAREGSIANPFELTPESSALTTCPDVEFIFVHGASVTVATSQDASAWYQAFLHQNLLESDLALDYYYLGESTYSGGTYRGASIGLDSLSQIRNTAETFFSAGKSGGFNDSVKAGILEMNGRVSEVISKCPATKFVFGGYSEGAYVLHEFFNGDTKSLGLTGDKVIYIATFGDPKLYLPEGEGINPPACRDKNFSTYRVYAPNCYAHSGILGAEKPHYFPVEYLDKAGLWCTKKDIMCSNYVNIFDLDSGTSDHVSYAWHEPYPYEQAAIVIRNKLSELFPDKISPSDQSTSFTARDTAILIDTTGSMASTIDQYHSEALKIAKNTISSGGRIALFEYRDLKADGQDLVPHELCDFSCTYEEFEEKINNLSTDGGGDEPESVLSASLSVLNKLSWQKGATKSIVLLTDATYHNIDFDGTSLSDVVKRSLEIDPVNFYVVAPSKIATYYHNLTSSTNGETFNLTADDIALSGKTLLSRPDLNFQFESYAFTTGEIANFIVKTTASDIDHFEWDLDLDGVFELSTTTPTISRLYSAPISGFIQAKIITKSGLSSTASATITITANDSTLSSAPEITRLQATPENNIISTTYEWSSDTSAVIVVLDNYILGITKETSFKIQGLTSGEHRLSLVPISISGLRGEPKTIEFNFRAAIPLAPNTSLPRR